MLTLKSVNKLLEDIVRDIDLDEAVLDKVKRLKKTLKSVIHIFLKLVKPLMRMMLKIMNICLMSVEKIGKHVIMI